MRIAQGNKVVALAIAPHEDESDEQEEQDKEDLNN